MAAKKSAPKKQLLTKFLDGSPVDGPDLERSPREIKRLEQATRLIVTSAQNNTPVCKPFWAAIRRYADKTDAQIIVIPVRYRNPTSPLETTRKEDEIWWPEEVQPYLVANEVRVHPHLWVMGNIRVQATGESPITGLETLTRGASGVFGHAQIQMRTIPTPQHALPKIMHTTGSVSEKNYSRSKAGAKASFHHSLGAVVIETDGDRFHLRVVNADSNNGFYDLEHYFSAGGIRRTGRVSALVTGDEHAWFMDPKVRASVYGGSDAEVASMVSVLRPEVLIRHDVFDGYSITHHHRKNPLVQFAKLQAGYADVQRELEDTAKHIDATTPKGTKNIIVPSNHHAFLLRWLLEADIKREPWNAPIYHELWCALLRSVQMTEIGVRHADPFAHWSESRVKSDCMFLSPEQQYRIHDILVSMHGHDGPNGARGNLRNFSRIGTKVVIGHAHTPGIEKGAYQVGTCTPLTLEYTVGQPSSWLNVMCIIYPNGKRQLINVIGGRWRGKGENTKQQRA